jgi:hypothetical protein
MEPNYSPVPTSALIALAHLRLKRMRVHLPAETREQALFIHRYVRDVPPRKAVLHIKPVYDLCCVCYKPMTTGTLCDSLGRRHSYCEVK